METIVMDLIDQYNSPKPNNSDSDEKMSENDSEMDVDTTVDSDDDKFMGPSRGPQKEKSKSSSMNVINNLKNLATPSAEKVVSVERFKYIPLRLTEDERCLLNVLENALEVCEYTDVVDVTFSHTRKSKVSRIFESLVDILSISCGLLMSNNLSRGEHILSGKTLTENVPLFRELFEIARRHKIMNPAKMRNTYGKLMYILMDTQSYVIKSELKIDWVKPIKTVYNYLKKKEALSILKDPLLEAATQSISNDQNELSPGQLAKMQARKKAALEAIITKYTSDSLTSADIQRVIDSIADNEAYLSFNVKPVEKIIAILKESFNANKAEEHFSLALNHKAPKKMNYFGYGMSMGFMSGGAQLSHDHATQYKFVLQSFTLWREIMANMPKLWMFADGDMTTQDYRLVDTGQGYQRLQSSPQVRGEMNRILSLVQRQVGNWVGLSVVHLGDRDVPNALVFIDKYTQVPRILAPIVQCIESLPNLVEDRAFHKYVSTEWGSIDGLRLQVLSDFFKHGFDGSGDDGGSCIDGRLTSAWNWCSKLHKKPYYYVFMFTGFQGFDGDWKEN